MRISRLLAPLSGLALVATMTLGAPPSAHGAPTPLLCNLLVANILGTTGADVITGTAGNDIISAGDGNDQINGMGGNDVICGGPGNDTIDGNTGTDTVIGNAGSDVLSGGSGTDTVSYFGTTDAVTLILLNQATAGGESDTLAGFENAIGGSGADNIRGTAATNVLNGGGGNDTLRGDTGNDRLDGDAGTDTVTYSQAAAAITATINGTATGDGTDTLVETENLIGSPQADRLNGDAANNTIRGGSGADNIFGGAGNDALAGESGADRVDGEAGADTITATVSGDIIDGGIVSALNEIDTVTFASVGAGVNINLTTGIASSPGLTNDSLGNIEDVIGTSFNDSITATALTRNRLTGLGGNDVLVSATNGSSLSAQDTLVPGLGNDSVFGPNATVDFTDVGVGITINLAAGTATGAGTDTLVGITRVTTGVGNDTIDGSNAIDIINTGAGNDVVRAAGGADGIDLGAGNDDVDPGSADNVNAFNTVAGGDGTDTIRFTSAGSATVTASLATGFSQTSTSQRSSFTGMENLTGGAGNDILTGNSANNVINGAGGTDTCTGGGGTDTFISCP